MFMGIGAGRGAVVVHDSTQTTLSMVAPLVKPAAPGIWYIAFHNTRRSVPRLRISYHARRRHGTDNGLSRTECFTQHLRHVSRHN